MRVITLTTDFGLADSYVGAMKGVILCIAPQTHIVDITHLTPPQDVRRAMAVLQEITPYYPTDAIHVVVVDPGVGSQRRALAVRTAQGFFVGPDNGVFTQVIADAAAAGACPVILHLDNPTYWLPAVSRTFHGRDIFAPVAAHLAAGVPLARLGTPIDDPVTLPLLRPNRLADGCIHGHVVAIDRFGNLISDVPAEWLAGRRWRFAIAGRWVDGLSPTYAAAAPGELLALIGSNERLEIAVRDGNAAQLLRVPVGEPIEATPHETVMQAP